MSISYCSVLLVCQSLYVELSLLARQLSPQLLQLKFEDALVLLKRLLIFGLGW